METLETLSKEAIIAQLEIDLKEKSTEELIASTKHLKAQFEEATEKEKQLQLQAYEAETGNVEGFEYTANPLDSKFAELYNVLQDKKTAFKQEQARKEEENYKAKLEIINSLKALTESELINIGEAFKQFYELRDKWNEIGTVNQARYKQLQFDYSHLQDVFYYNVGIHKELKNYDFKKNAELKEKIIDKLQNLLHVDSIRQLEHFIKEYQNEWDAAGPTTQEKWEELKNRYWELVNAVYEKIRLHYLNLREQQKEALEKKNQLLESVKNEIAKVTEQSKIAEWNNITDFIIKAQEEWKKSGLIKKAKEQALFEEFRAAVDAFFSQKGEYFGELKDKQKKAENKKRDLIAKVNAIKESTDWNNTGKQIIRLQEEWKKSGNTHPKVDQKLWTEFRAACDYFFNAKKQYFDTLDDRLEANLTKKTEAAGKIANATSAQEFSTAVEEWHTVGFVPKKNITESNTAFDKAVKTAAEKLKLENTEDLVFEAKINAFKKSENAKELLFGERKFLQEKIEKIKSELAQYENNLAFFGPSKGAQKLKEAVEAKMTVAKENLEKLQSKFKLVRE